MSPKSIAATLILALGLSQGDLGQAAGETPTRAGGKRPPAQSEVEDPIGRSIFQALIGDFALQRGDARLASDAWSDLAVRTRDPAIVARAAEVSTQARQYDRALELVKLWLELEPDSSKARQMQSALFALTNRIDELAPQLGLLLEQDKPNLANNLLQLNRLLARISDKKLLQQLVDRLSAPYAGLPEAHFAMAQAAANADDNLRALQETEKALLLRPDWEIAALARAQLQARHSEASAIDSLQQFVDRHPGARDARLTLARMLINAKRYDESRQHFDRLLKDNPDSPEIVYPLAMLSLQLGNIETGRQLLERLLQTDFQDKSTAHFFLGQLAQDQKQLDAALEHYRQVSTGEQFIPARSRAAQILMQQGKPDAARELLHDTRGNTPAEQVQLLLAEAQLLRDAGRHNDAYIALASALGAQPDNPDLLYEAALTAERIGKPEILEQHLQHLLKLKPDHPHALNALGYSWAERNIRLNEADKLIAKALSLAPDDPFIMDSMGWVKFRQGKLPEALKTLETAYRLRADPEIAAHLGEVLWKLNRKDEARHILGEAAKQHPDNDVLAGTIKKLLP